MGTLYGNGELGLWFEYPWIVREVEGWLFRYEYDRDRLDDFDEPGDNEVSRLIFGWHVSERDFRESITNSKFEGTLPVTIDSE